MKPLCVVNKTRSELPRSALPEYSFAAALQISMTVGTIIGWRR
jgi:hypothetical protein